MVRITSLTRRNETVADSDESVGERGTTLTERKAARRHAIDRAAAEREAAARDGDKTVVLDGRSTGSVTAPARGRATVVEQPVRRPRASGLATLSLLLGVLAAAAVATGVLAAPGVAVGLLGTLVSVGGLVATSRAHVTGRMHALLGLLLSLGAAIVGLLALTNSISWLDTDTNQVSRLVDWLDAAIPWLSRF